MNDLAQLLPFVLIAAVFWFLLIRPQRKRQMELMRTQRGLEVGDEVLLGSGIVGRVAELPDDEFLHLEVAPGVRIKALRGAIVRNMTERPAEQQDADADDPVTSELPDDPSAGHGRDH